jgi:DNA-directed RNA polymerase subunit M/transcription elongation factor TFIIS
VVDDNWELLSKRKEGQLNKSGMDVLPQVSDISKDGMKKIWDNVKENHKKLDSCNLHDFSIDLNPEKKIGKRWQCQKCSGKVDAAVKEWYESGVRDAIKNVKSHFKVSAKNAHNDKTRKEEIIMNPEFTKVREPSYLKLKFAIEDTKRNGLPPTPARWQRLFKWSYTLSHEILQKITKFHFKE